MGNVDSVSGRIVRHFRTDKVDKNKLLENNLKLISGFNLDKCLGAISLTLDSVRYSSSDVTPVIRQSIANESGFINNTNELSGNQNHHKWFSRDVTRGAMIQLFMLTFRIAQLEGIDTNGLKTRDDKISFMLKILTNHHKDGKFDDVMKSSVIKSANYLDGCHCASSSLFEIYGGSQEHKKDFNGYGLFEISNGNEEQSKNYSSNSNSGSIRDITNDSLQQKNVYSDAVIVKLLLYGAERKVTLSNCIDGVYELLQLKNSKDELVSYHGKFRLEENERVTVESDIVRVINQNDLLGDVTRLFLHKQHEMFCLPSIVYICSQSSGINTITVEIFDTSGTCVQNIVYNKITNKHGEFYSNWMNGNSTVNFETRQILNKLHQHTQDFNIKGNNG